MSKELADGYEYCKETLALRVVLEQGFITIGERLHNILEKKLYESNWDSWGEFLEDLRIDNTTASKLIKIYRVFVLEYGINRKQLALVGRESAYEITSVVKNKKEAVEWLKKGQDLKRDDIRLAIKELKSGVLQADCDHDWYRLEICRKCGDRHPIV